MLPKYATWELVAERLPTIFPEGIAQRNYCIRELSAKTIFTFLYIGAIEGTDVYLGPIHVYRMTDRQSNMSSDDERLAYRSNMLKKSFHIEGVRWYADNTREPIRDETLREGLIIVGAVVERTDVPTTSSRPRYSLNKDLADLFDPALTDSALTQAILAWQTKNLTPSALARVSLLRMGAAGKTGVPVQFPSGDTRTLSPGPSSLISKAVVEVFASRFLKQPGVLWLSESSNKVAVQDVKLATAIGLDIVAKKDLPDLILVDLGPVDPLIIFVEVVATDGAITPRRQRALFELTDKGGFERSQVVFLTAYADRESPGFKKTITGLAWGAYVWFMSEPDNIVLFQEGGGLIPKSAGVLSLNGDD
ncbi:BsuBI/PstI family type II restriction endonuclease [Pseudomonas viridiflava]|uniref:BsuBI/PstI family type II restriction endonuclease n=1 Tax=Pseudomonas viridiflava TaxID=33069 RepID=UPI000F011F5F|nr:BsuBI/PstI family type II restriction endonuclease [Pseudomonas viridiflava]